MMSDKNKGTLKGAIFGVGVTVAAALVIALGSGFVHWVKNDSQIASSAARLDKVEPALVQIQFDLSAFHADHAALHKQVDDNHREEMEAISDLKVQAAENARIAARALAVFQNKSMSQITSPRSGDYASSKQ